MRRPALLLACLAALLALASACGGEAGAGPETEIGFVSNRDGDYAIYGMRADGSGEERLTPGDDVLDTPGKVFFQIEPAWSPDGSLIAFASRRSGRSHIYVMRQDGTGTKKLTAGTRNDSNPSWSPDGTRIAFERNEELFVMAADGTGARPVTKALGGTEADPAWSPDGEWLAYVRRLPGYSTSEIWRVRPDGTGSTMVTGLNATSYTPAWSPDSRRIIFSNNADDGHYQLYEIGLDGKGIERLTFQPAEYFDPTWSPDGTTLVFERDGVIYARSADGGETTLTDGPNDGSPVWRPARLER